MDWNKLKNKFLAFIMINRGKNNIQFEQSSIRSVYFEGAWKEDGVAKWAFFKEKYEEKIRSEDILEEPSSEKEISENLNGVTESPQGIVNITELGKCSSRYHPLDNIDNVIKQEDIPPDKKIEVFLVEDMEPIQKLLSVIVKKCPDMNLLGIAGNGNEAIDFIKSSPILPEVILMDICMPDMDGISATREILKSFPEIKIIMLTALSDRDNVINSFSAGAIGFLRKDAGNDVITTSIRKASMGGAPIQPEVAIHLLKRN